MNIFSTVTQPVHPAQAKQKSGLLGKTAYQASAGAQPAPVAQVPTIRAFPATQAPSAPVAQPSSQPTQVVAYGAPAVKPNADPALSENISGPHQPTPQYVPPSERDLSSGQPTEEGFQDWVNKTYPGGNWGMKAVHAGELEGDDVYSIIRGGGPRSHQRTAYTREQLWNAYLEYINSNKTTQPEQPATPPGQTAGADDTSALEQAVQARLDSLSSITDQINQIGGAETSQQQNMKNDIANQMAAATSQAASRRGMNRGLAAKLLADQRASVQNLGNESLGFQRIADQQQAARSVQDSLGGLENLDTNLYKTLSAATLANLQSKYKAQIEERNRQLQEALANIRAKYAHDAAIAGRPEDPSTGESIFNAITKLVPAGASLFGAFA